MCLSTNSLGDLCRRMADLEYDLQYQIHTSQEGSVRLTLAQLKSRGDTRASDILEHYAGLSKPLDEEMPKLLVGVVEE